ncbi:MAG: DUF1178 family protein [Pseudomonadota bacterium]
MIRYTLQCDASHEFESWFADSAAFESQNAQNLVACPFCESTRIAKTLMAPSVASAKEPAPSLTEPASPAEGMIKAMREKIEAGSDYVGTDFASEARRIHLGETEARGIWGEATHDDAKALTEEGVPVAPIPFMRRHDS